LPLLSRGRAPLSAPTLSGCSPGVRGNRDVCVRRHRDDSMLSTNRFARSRRAYRPSKTLPRATRAPHRPARMKRFDAERRAELSRQHRLLLATFVTQASQVKHSCDIRERATSLRRRARDVAHGQCNERDGIPCVAALEPGMSNDRSNAGKAERHAPFQTRHVAERGRHPRAGRASAASIPACARAISRSSWRGGGGSQRQQGGHPLSNAGRDVRGHGTQHGGAALRPSSRCGSSGRRVGQRALPPGVRRANARRSRRVPCGIAAVVLALS